MGIVGHLYDQVINVLAYLLQDDCLRHGELEERERGDQHRKLAVLS